MFKRTLTAAAAASIAFAVPAVAQNQGGLVNVNLSDIRVDLQNILSNNNVAVNVPVSAAVPIGIAAQICNVDVNVLAQQKGDRTCKGTVANEQTANALSRVLNSQRQ